MRSQVVVAKVDAPIVLSRAKLGRPRTREVGMAGGHRGAARRAAFIILTVAVMAAATREGSWWSSEPLRAERAAADRTDDAAAGATALPVTVTANEAERRVDVAVGGRPFTSYLWIERLRKPVLDPIRSASGTLVTRGWPLNPRPGERVDHP